MNHANKIFLGVVSAALISATTLWEGTKYKPYEDVVGVLTVCTGYAGKDVVKGKQYTKEECSYLLTRELANHRNGILKCINVPLKENEIDAYTMFAYNVGVTAFCNSKSIIVPLNQGKHEEACKGMLKWVYSKGKFVKGLQNRRIYEVKMCLGELNATQKGK